MSRTSSCIHCKGYHQLVYDLFVNQLATFQGYFFWNLVFTTFEICRIFRVETFAKCVIFFFYLVGVKYIYFFFLTIFFIIDIFVKIYLEEIYKCFQHIRDVEMISCSNENNKELDIILLISSQGQQLEKSNLLSCFNDINTTNPKFCVPLTSVNKITKFLALLHLFPM